MKPVNVHEAKTHLSRLLRRVARGEEVVIAKAGRPIARLVPLDSGAPPRVFGTERGRFQTPANFDAPLPADLLDFFER